MAARIGLDAIAITDHDTLMGARQAFQSNFPSALRFISGVEISTALPENSGIRGGIHVLGYGIDLEDEALGQSLEKFKKIRDNRIDKIVERLNSLGVDITLEQVHAEVGSGVAGRPHVASAMIKTGVARNVDDAFNRYLGDEGPAYVPKERFDCQKAFDLIVNAGGVPVLAHPYLVKCPDFEALSELVARLCDMGLRGIEVHYPQHTPKAVAQYLSLADKFGLIVTGGSDFHGRLTPDIQLGRGRGDLHVPTSLFDQLLLNCSTEYTR